MNKDIVPELLGKIQSEFKNKTAKSEIIRRKIAALNNNKATHKDSNEFAIEVGNILADVFKNEITEDVLPDNKMYYNIAKRLIEPNMKNNYDLVSDYSRNVQEVLNKKSNISLKAIKPELNQDRIDGIVNKICDYDDFNQGKWLLDEPVKNFTQSVVDDTIKTNADFQYKSGLRPKIIRKEVGNCCPWCKEVVGVYEYPNVPKDVYRRHQRCKCTVDYIPGDGKKQDVWSKKWTDDNTNAKSKRIDFSEIKVNSKLSIIATAKALELGYNPLPNKKVVNILRKDGKKWIQILNENEIRAIKKYTYNGKDKDGLRLFEKINGYLENRYDPTNENEEEIILRNIYNIEQGILKNKLKHDIIVYRREDFPESLNGKVQKFLSTSVTKRGVLKKSPNVAIIVPKGSNGAYVEQIADNRFKKQREFLLNKNNSYKTIYNDNNLIVYIVEAKHESN